MAEGAMGDWSAIYIRMDLGAAPATAAFCFAALSLTMAIGRLTGDRLVARFGPAGMVVAGAVIGALTLGAARLPGYPVTAVLGFAGMGLGLANIAPIVFSAAGRLPDLAPGIGIAAVSTARYCGFLAGPPLIGLVAEVSGLPARARPARRERRPDDPGRRCPAAAGRACGSAGRLSTRRKAS